MDIANVVFVCGRYIRRNDPLLEVENMVYSNIVAGFSFSLLQNFGPNFDALVQPLYCRLGNIDLTPRYRGGLLAMRQLVLSEARILPCLEIHLICADWYYETDEKEFSVQRSCVVVRASLKFSLNFSSSSFAIRVNLLHP